MTLLKRNVPAVLAREWSNPVSRSGMFLLINTASTGALGLIYWLLAARLYPQASVGRAGALVSAATLLSGVGQMNLSGMLMRFLPDARERSRQLVLLAYAAASLCALALTGAGAFAVSLLVSRTSALHLPLLAGIMFAVSVLATVVFTLQDSVLVAVRRTGWIPIENGAFGVAKIVLLALFVPLAGWSAIFASWMLPLAGTIPLISWLLFRRFLPRKAAPGTLGPVLDTTKHQIRRFVFGDASAGLFTQAWTYLLPVIVTGALGARQNALFYAAFLFSSTLDQVASNFTSALVVEGARNEARLAELTRGVLKRTYLLLAPAVLLFVVLAPLALEIYGHAYAAGAACLRLLALACLPKAMLYIYYGVCRIRRQTHRSAALQGLTCVTVLAGAVAASTRGLAAMALVVLGVQLLVAGAALPSLLRLVRPGRGLRGISPRTEAVGT